jgi:hypothetical protein
MSRHLAPQVAQNIDTSTLFSFIFSGGALALMAVEPHLGHFSPLDSMYDLKVIPHPYFFHVL